MPVVWLHCVVTSMFCKYATTGTSAVSPRSAQTIHFHHRPCYSLNLQVILAQVKYRCVFTAL